MLATATCAATAYALPPGEAPKL